MSPGGSPANVALGLGRLGRNVTLVTQLGADEHGVLITRQLSEAGVHVVTTGSRDVRTSTSTARLSADGSASYIFDLTWDVEVDITPPTVGHPALVHTGSLAAVLSPGSEATSAARWAALGPTLVVLTRGAEGASAWLGRQRIDVPAVLVTVVDTVGAGDAFMAALLDALVVHVDDRRLAGLTVEQGRSALQAGAAAAAVTVSRRGADLPWLRDSR